MPLKNEKLSHLKLFHQFAVFGCRTLNKNGQNYQSVTFIQDVLTDLLAVRNYGDTALFN